MENSEGFRQGDPAVTFIVTATVNGYVHSDQQQKAAMETSFVGAVNAMKNYLSEDSPIQESEVYVEVGLASGTRRRLSSHPVSIEATVHMTVPNGATVDDVLLHSTMLVSDTNTFQTSLEQQMSQNFGGDAPSVEGVLSVSDPVRTNSEPPDDFGQASKCL